MIVLTIVAFGADRLGLSSSQNGTLSAFQSTLGRPFLMASKPVDQAILSWNDSWRTFLNGRQLRSENERLKNEVMAASFYQEQIQLLEARIDSLRRLNGFPSLQKREKVSANVLTYDPTTMRFQVNVGSKNGVVPGLAVVTGEGLMGRIEFVGSDRSVGIICTSPDFRIGAMVMSNPIASGLIRGRGGLSLRLDNTQNDAAVKVGDMVTTSSYSEVIPAFLPIGRISQAQHQPEMGLRSFVVQTSVNPLHVEEVWVIR